VGPPRSPPKTLLPPADTLRNYEERDSRLHENKQTFLQSQLHIQSRKHLKKSQRNLPLLQAGFSGLVLPAMVRREKCRRPKTLIVDVMGSQVGVNGSPLTVCFLCSQR